MACNVLIVPSMTTSGQSRGKRQRRNLDLIALRINAGMSRDDLGRRSGIGRETIRLAEAGFVPTPRVQYALAKAFGQLPLDIWPIEHQRAAR
jgi:transcriptional regulator with XRE-family HTH domain